MEIEWDPGPFLIVRNEGRMTVMARFPVFFLLISLIVVPCAGGFLDREPGPLPLDEWTGKKFVFLSDYRDGERYRAGFTHFSRGERGSSTIQNPPTFRELAGRVATLNEIKDYGINKILVFEMTDNGAVYSTTMEPSLTFDYDAYYAWNEKGIPGLALLEDIQHARQKWTGKTLILNVEFIETVDPATGDLFFLHAGRFSPARVIDVIPGFSHERPVRFLLRTHQGQEGYVDVNMTGTNVPANMQSFNRFDDRFIVNAYRNIRLVRVVTDLDYIRLEGVSDLPNGSELQVSMDVGQSTLKSRTFSTQTSARVHNGWFKASFTLDATNTFNPGPYRIRLSFSPSHQSDKVRWYTGDEGDNLRGPLVRTLPEGKRILVLEEIHRMDLVLRAERINLKKTEKTRIEYGWELIKQLTLAGCEVEVDISGTYKTSIDLRSRNAGMKIRDLLDLDELKRSLKELGFQKMTLRSFSGSAWTLRIQ